MSDVVVVVGPGQIGQSIARRVGVGKKLLLADVRIDNAEAAANVLSEIGHDVTAAAVDVSSRDAVGARHLAQLEVSLIGYGTTSFASSYGTRRPRRTPSTSSALRTISACARPKNNGLVTTRHNDPFERRNFNVAVATAATASENGARGSETSTTGQTPCTPR
jgi:hypothetical protein